MRGDSTWLFIFLIYRHCLGNQTFISNWLIGHPWPKIRYSVMHLRRCYGWLWQNGRNQRKRSCAWQIIVERERNWIALCMLEMNLRSHSSMLTSGGKVPPPEDILFISFDRRWVLTTKSCWWNPPLVRCRFIMPIIESLKVRTCLFPCSAFLCSPPCWRTAVNQG